MGGLSVGRVAVISDPGAIRRVLMANVDNYQKDWLQRRVLSSVLANGLLSADLKGKSSTAEITGNLCDRLAA